MERRQIIMIIIGLIILIGALVGLTLLSNVTGNVITGGLVNNRMTVEQESFEINDNVNVVEVDNGSQDSG